MRGVVTLTKYGYSIEVWEKAKEEIRQILIQRAKDEDFIFYSDLTQLVR